MWGYSVTTMSNTNPWPPLDDCGPVEVKRPRLKINITAVIAWIKRKRKMDETPDVIPAEETSEADNGI